MEDINEKFKGVWIPKEILNLEIKDKKAGNLKILLSMIISLEHKEKGCYATNLYFAEILNLSQGHISDMITYLFDNMLISRTIFQAKGNKRILRSLIEIGTDNPIMEKDNTYKEITVYPILEKDNTYKEITVYPIMEKPIHDNKVYKTLEIKNEREIKPLTHFEFFKISFSEEFEKWKEDYGNKIFNQKDFKAGFNNKMELENFPKNKKIIPRLNEYARQWIRNQKESDRHAVTRSFSHLKTIL